MPNDYVFGPAPVLILAWMLTFITLSALFRLMLGVKARPTSWAIWIILAEGVVFIRLPQAYGWEIPDWFQLFARFVAYLISAGLCIFDWINFYKSKKGQRRKEKDDL